MSKLETAQDLIWANPDQANHIIARAVGCDERIVRQARQVVEIESLRQALDSTVEMVHQLKDELARYRRASKPPGKAKPGEFCPLWEELSPNETPVPRIPMIQ